MYKIGLTGGIGSGKSRVADFFKEWGAAVIDTDVIAHQLTQAGGAAIEPISQAFGSEVIALDGSLNRGAMRDLVFADALARQRLEAIVHPMIGVVTQCLAEQAEGCYLVFVVPLLVESGRWRSRVDRICVVDCDPETQILRVQARSGLTPEAITRIMSAQASRSERLAAADDVVLNDAGVTVATLARSARKLHEKWCVQAKYCSN